VSKGELSGILDRLDGLSSVSRIRNINSAGEPSPRPQIKCWRHGDWRRISDRNHRHLL